MAYTSSVPAAIAALVSLFTSSPGLAGVEVNDGPALPDTSAVQAVYVGWSPDDPALAVDGTAAREGLGGPYGPDREQYTVHCAVQVLNGDADIVAARAQAYTLASAALGAVASHRRLGGLQLLAGPGTLALRQQISDVGALATVTFDIDVDAYTSQ